MEKSQKCPNCGSEEFITEPNRYDLLTFSKDGFEIMKSYCLDEYKIFCRECSKEVDPDKSINEIILKNK